MPLTRSENMARIRGRDTSPELALRAALVPLVPSPTQAPVGRPDLVFPDQRVAVFVDGCFWHGCPDHYVRPRSRQEFWSSKLQQNVERDIRQDNQLQEKGWISLRFWECDVRERLEQVTQRIRESLAGTLRDPESSWRVTRVELIDPATNLERRHLLDLQGSQKIEERIRTTNKRGRSGGSREVGTTARGRPTEGP